MKQKIKHCKFCGEPFVVVGRQIYCSKSCKDKHYYYKKHPLEERICEYCEKPFIPTHNNQQTCSKSCARELRLIKNRKYKFKLQRQFPELYYNDLGSKGTSTSYKLYRDKNGEPDFDKELKWLKREKRRLGIKDGI